MLWEFQVRPKNHDGLYLPTVSNRSLVVWPVYTILYTDFYSRYFTIQQTIYSLIHPNSVSAWNFQLSTIQFTFRCYAIFRHYSYILSNLSAILQLDWYKIWIVRVLGLIMVRLPIPSSQSLVIKFNMLDIRAWDEDIALHTNFLMILMTISRGRLWLNNLVHPRIPLEVAISISP